jgi:hypothetical protein
MRVSTILNVRAGPRGVDFTGVDLCDRDVMNEVVDEERWVIDIAVDCSPRSAQPCRLQLVAYRTEPVFRGPAAAGNAVCSCDRHAAPNENVFPVMDRMTV